MKPAGGSELAYQALLANLGGQWPENINFILSSCNPDFVDPNKINVVWQQLNWNEENVALMADQNFVDSIDHFVYVSHWCYDKFRNKFDIPHQEKSHVIKNAVYPLENKPKPRTEKLKLIYTSTPWRGLDVLLDAFELLGRDDVELDVYSSTTIYGDFFHNSYGAQFNWIFDRAKAMPNVNYMGYASNPSVRKAVQAAHIFAYPSMFEETSCISAIEAGAAGCQMVVSDYGALYETCAQWATFVPYVPDRKQMAINYAPVLNKAIDEYWSTANQSKLIAQVNYYNRFWTWDYRMTEWRDFFDRISNQKT